MADNRLAGKSVILIVPPTQFHEDEVFEPKRNDAKTCSSKCRQKAYRQSRQDNNANGKYSQNTNRTSNCATSSNNNAALSSGLG